MTPERLKEIKARSRWNECTNSYHHVWLKELLAEIAAIEERDAIRVSIHDERLHEVAQLRNKVVALEERCEQLTVQLAGCDVAALGGTNEPATSDMYGWSAAYQSVLNLRLKYAALEQRLAQALKLADLSQENEIRWMQKHSALEARCQELEEQLRLERVYMKQCRENGVAP
jgi:DNA repair exonuclease SbcCD ATPase subunit